MSDQGLVVVDHIDGLRAMADWLEAHPAVAAALSHSAADVHTDHLPHRESIEVLGAMMREFGPEAERYELKAWAVVERRFGPSKLKVKIPRDRLPLQPSGRQISEMVRAWPS